ncbi:MAG: hypothetical protein MUO59_00535 [Actinobacteria bacterium]|nr:hypothetical protein [Actinomycetota bacterium]
MYFLIVLLMLIAVMLFALGGCSISTIIREAYSSEDESLKLRDMKIDEKEVESINVLEKEMEQNYDISKGISNLADDLEDPFRPFFTVDEDNTQKNILMLEDITTDAGIDSCEIKFNDNTYLLEEGDIFLKIYQVQSISDESVAILKGDEILTLHIGVMIYD